MGRTNKQAPATPISDPEFDPDLAAALRRMGNDRALFREVTEMIMEDYKTHLSSLHESMCRASWVSLKKHAHALRGIVATYGPDTQLCQDLQELEDVSETGEIGRIADLETRISREMSEFISKIHLFLDGTNDQMALESTQSVKSRRQFYRNFDGIIWKHFPLSPQSDQP